MKKALKVFLMALLVISSIFAIVGCGGGEKEEKFEVKVNGGTGGGKFDPNTEATITAEVPEGKAFVNWTVGTEVFATVTPYTFEVVEDVEITANFVNVYAITVTNGTGGGAAIVENSTVTLVPTIPAGKKFVNWMEGTEVASTDNPYVFAATADRTLVATFEDLKSYAITVEGGVSNKETVLEGATCTVTATIPTGKKFVKWTVEGVETSTANPYTFAPTADTALVAVFEDLPSYQVNVVGGIGGGLIFGGNKTYVVANEVGKTFVNWTSGTEIVSTNSAYEFTPTANITLTANYVDTNTQFADITNDVFSPEAPNNNLIAIAMDRMFRNFYPSIPEGAQSRHESIFNDSEAFANGDDVDYILVAVYEDPEASPVGYFKYYENKVESLIGNYEYEQTVEWSYKGNLYIESAGISEFLAECLPNYNNVIKYYFSSQLIAKVGSDSANGNITAVTDRYYVETPGENYLITVENGTAPGGRQGEGPYTVGVMAGSPVTITAVVEEGYQLIGWSLDGATIEGATGNTYTFTPTAACTISAVVEAIPSDVTDPIE